MSRTGSHRRAFLRRGLSLGATGVFVPYPFSRSSGAEEPTGSKNDRPVIAAIGVGGRGTAIVKSASRFGDVAAVCDVDRNNAARARELFGGKPAVYQDYRKPPAATVDVAHRVITACHLGNIAIRLKRRIVWDAQKEEIVGDSEAAQSIYVRRPQRAPYQIIV